MAVLAVCISTTVAALVVFNPLRRRFGTVYAPAVAHVLFNGIGLLATRW